MIIIECDADEVFIKIITVNKKIKHENGKNEVLKRMNKNHDYNGMVDEDLGTQSKELPKYTMIDDQHDTSFLEHQSRPDQRLVILKPRFEEWLYQRANFVGLRVTSYGLPTLARDLKRIPHYEQKRGFRDLASDLLKADDLILRIAEWLN